MTETPLDRAAMLADAPDAGDAERAHYYEVFAAAEFFLAIEPETLESKMRRNRFSFRWKR